MYSNADEVVYLFTAGAHLIFLVDEVTTPIRLQLNSAAGPKDEVMFG